MGVTERILSSLIGQCSVSCLVLFVLCLVLVLVLQYILYLRTLPPGPWGIPVLGSLANFKKAFHLQMYDFAQQFGALVSVKMGSQLIVTINDVKLLKKMFARSEFTARPKSALDSIVEGYGLITADGSLWENQRRFIHRHKFGLKFWGNIGEQMEARVNHEVLDCLNALAKDSEERLDPSPYLSCSISNVICSIIMSTRFRHHEPRFREFINFFDEGFKLFTLTGPMIFLPFLRHIPFMARTCDKLRSNRAELLDFVGEIVEEHRQSLDPKAPRDLVDNYLMEIERTEQEGTTDQVFGSKDPETQLRQVLVDLFSAGFETVKTTLLWTFVHMLRNPEIQRKVQEELEQVVGSNRLPTLEDMSRLHYTRACIYESMRRSTAVPMGTTHSNTRPVLVEGHLIPANSHVIPNLYAIHMDPSVWEEPEAYCPARFLDPATGVLVKPRHFLPFGTGQRMCLGDQLAETELQLFFASILHVFDLEPVEGAPLPSLEGNLGATLTPASFNVHLVPRNVEALIHANTRSKPSHSHHMRIYG